MDMCQSFHKGPYVPNMNYANWHQEAPAEVRKHRPLPDNPGRIYFTRERRWVKTARSCQSHVNCGFIKSKKHCWRESTDLNTGCSGSSPLILAQAMKTNHLSLLCNSGFHPLGWHINKKQILAHFSLFLSGAKPQEPGSRLARKLIATLHGQDRPDVEDCPRLTQHEGDQSGTICLGKFQWTHSLWLKGSSTPGVQ